MIGFDGEQFVVGALKKHLSDFDELSHWTSRLRFYAGFPAYEKSEVTDLTYPDTHGAFSKFILEQASGSVPDWLERSCAPGAKRPTYALEVKTTTGACETPFIISRNQYGIVSGRL
jgi:hypothetical protein